MRSTSTCWNATPERSLDLGGLETSTVRLQGNEDLPLLSDAAKLAAGGTRALPPESKAAFDADVEDPAAPAVIHTLKSPAQLPRGRGQAALEPSAPPPEDSA